MRYYIADLHFFHENLNTKMDKRGFANVNAMNDYMLKQWNSKVRNRDEVVILGDLSWGKSEETNQLLQKLNGRETMTTMSRIQTSTVHALSGLKCMRNLAIIREK